MKKAQRQERKSPAKTSSRRTAPSPAIPTATAPRKAKGAATQPPAASPVAAKSPQQVPPVSSPRPAVPTVVVAAPAPSPPPVARLAIEPLATEAPARTRRGLGSLGKQSVDRLGHLDRILPALILRKAAPLPTVSALAASTPAVTAAPTEVLLYLRDELRGLMALLDESPSTH